MRALLLAILLSVPAFAQDGFYYSPPTTAFSSATFNIGSLDFGGSNTLDNSGTYIVASQNFRTNGNFDSQQSSGNTAYQMLQGARICFNSGAACTSRLSFDGTNMDMTVAGGNSFVITGSLITTGDHQTSGGWYWGANNATFTYYSRVADGASAVGHTIRTSSTLSNSGAKLATWQNNTTDKIGIHISGKFILPTGQADSVAGRAVLSSGTVTVSTTSVTASSIIQLTRCVAGGTVGELQVGTVVAGTSFVINSVQPGTASTVQSADTATVCWSILAN